MCSSPSSRTPGGSKRTTNGSGGRGSGCWIRIGVAALALTCILATLVT